MTRVLEGGKTGWAFPCCPLRPTHLQPLLAPPLHNLSAVLLLLCHAAGRARLAGCCRLAAGHSRRHDLGRICREQAQAQRHNVAGVQSSSSSWQATAPGTSRHVRLPAPPSTQRLPGQGAHRSSGVRPASCRAPWPWAFLARGWCRTHLAACLQGHGGKCAGFSGGTGTCLSRGTSARQVRSSLGR